MRSAAFLAIAGISVALSAQIGAQESMMDSPNCPVPPLLAPARYERLHQIPTTAAHDDVTHKIVTPGGMVLDTPKMVAATDVLTILARDQSTLCFDLLTLARERRKCELSGVARKDLDETFLYREGDIAVRFTFVADDQVRIEPMGRAHGRRCGSSGETEPIIFSKESR